MTRDEMIAALEGQGVKVDKRWSDETLQERLTAPAEEPAPVSPSVPQGMLRVRVTKFGDGKVANGKDWLEGAGVHFGRAKAGEELIVDKGVAYSLEHRGFAEIA